MKHLGYILTTYKEVLTTYLSWSIHTHQVSTSFPHSNQILFVACMWLDVIDEGGAASRHDIYQLPNVMHT